MPVASISEKPDAPPPAALPDFRNLGVMLRVLLGANVLGVMVALVQATSLDVWPDRYLEQIFRLQTALLVSLVLLALSARLLRRLPVSVARAVTALGVALVAVVLEGFWRVLGLSDVAALGEVARLALMGGGVATILLWYFALTERARLPAVNEAQTAALTARIRPHFLFNSLNAVLSLIRKEPQRAEEALENLAELFRVLMRDPRDLTLLSEEIELCRHYVDLEHLRLGDRLRVDWEIETVPADARIPPLMLQPLLENAIYHGIESSPTGGTVRICFLNRKGRLQIVIENPVSPDAPAISGNRMALDNIRQRLALFYDLDARLEFGERAGSYRVMIELPLRGGT